MRAAIVVLLAYVTGCDFGIVAVDPPVEYDKSAGLVEGDPGVELGQLSEQLYETLAPGDALPITRASQGGTWAHPALRTTGIGPSAIVDCTVIAADGELVGKGGAKQFFTYTGEGFLEVQAFPLLIAHTADDKGPEIDDLFGVAATISCGVIDAEDATLNADASVEVELSEG